MSLWKGNLSATYLWISYAMVQFTVYGIVKRWGQKFLDPMNKSYKTNDDKTSNAIKYNKLSVLYNTFILFLAGSTAGITATISTYPFDIMRTQFALQGKEKIHNNIKDFIYYTYKAKGIKGFFAGVAPAIIGIAPYMGLNFALYETFKLMMLPMENVISSKNSSTSVSMLRNSISGGLAGGVSKLLVYPLDTVKKR